MKSESTEPRTPVLQCPRCGAAPLSPNARGIGCPACKAQYPLIDGIPSLLPATYDEACRELFEQISAKGDFSAEAVGRVSESSHLAKKAAFAAMIVPPPRNCFILDVGCGHGDLMREWTANNTLVGVDLAVGMLALARQAGFQVYHGDATALPFDQNQFDVAMSLDVIQVIQDVRAAVAELLRVTRPGGSVLFSYPNRNSLGRKAYRVAAKLGLGPPSRTTFRRSWKELTDMLAGLPGVIQGLRLMYLPFAFHRAAKKASLADRVLASDYIFHLRKTS